MISLKHQGYVGVVDTVDDDAGVRSGSVIGIRDVIHFEGGSVEEVEASFVRAVEAYLALCEEEGVDPQKPKSGRFNPRVSQAS